MCGWVLCLCDGSIDHGGHDDCRVDCHPIKNSLLCTLHHSKIAGIQQQLYSQAKHAPFYSLETWSPSPRALSRISDNKGHANESDDTERCYTGRHSRALVYARRRSRGGIGGVGSTSGERGGAINCRGQTGGRSDGGRGGERQSMWSN